MTAVEEDFSAYLECHDESHQTLLDAQERISILLLLQGVVHNRS